MAVPAQPKLGVGIIGFGLSGKTFHATLLKDHPAFEVRKILTSRADEVRSFFTSSPVPKTVSDLDSLVTDPGIDLIVNCGPNSLHFDYSAAALRAGKHVVVEKPFVNR